MFRHIVIYWFHEPTKENLQEAKERLMGLKDKIPGLLSVEIGMDEAHTERSCDLCLNMVFESREALENYRTHPEHIPVQKFMHQVRRLSYSADYPME